MPPPEQIPAHSAMPVVGTDRTDRREHDGCQRRTHRQVRNNLRADPLKAERKNKHRDDNQPTADTEQASESAGKGAEGQIRCYFEDQRHSLSRTLENQGWYDTQRKSQLH